MQRKVPEINDQAILEQAELPINRAHEAELAALEAQLRNAVDDGAWQLYLQLDRARLRHYGAVVDAVFSAGKRAAAQLAGAPAGGHPH